MLMSPAGWIGKPPLGIEDPIPPRGAFPACGPTETQEASAAYHKSRTSAAVDGNYSPYEENKDKANAELQRLLDEGHLEFIGSWDEVLARWPKAIATKLAVLVKLKADGSEKVRFIVDTRRSSVNSLVEAGERIVLLRGQDLIEGVLDLWV